MTIAGSGPAGAVSPPPTSSNWDAGYAMNGAHDQVSASLRFVLPAVSCLTSPTPAQANVGIIVRESGALDTAAIVQWSCSAGVASYSAILAVIGSAAVVFTPRPGDVIEAKVLESSTTSKASVSDVTQGSGVLARHGSGGAPDSVFEGIERSQRLEPVPSFSSIRFSWATMDGLPPAGASAIRLFIIPKLGAGRVETGPLGAGGAAWTAQMDVASPRTNDRPVPPS